MVPLIIDEQHMANWTYPISLQPVCWLVLVVYDRKFSVGTVFFSHTNQSAVLFHEPATKRTSQPNRLMAHWPVQVAHLRTLPSAACISILNSTNKRTCCCRHRARTAPPSPSCPVSSSSILCSYEWPGARSIHLSYHMPHLAAQIA